jgi:predicted phage terminase large subunit-like protein
MWLRWPEWRAIFISGNPRVSLRDADYCRILLESDWYRGTFKPSWEFAKDQNAKSLYRNTAGGFRMAVTVGSRITGDRGDALCFDDCNDAAEVQSDTYRDGVNEWYDQGAGNRVNDLRCSVRIGISQRLHESDLSGHWLKSKAWHSVVIPQEYRRDAVSTNAIGWKDPRTVDGELMFPKRFPKEVLDAEKLRLGPTGYAGQHQQQPVPAGGSRFKAQYFRYWTERDGFYRLIGNGTERVLNKADCHMRFAAMDPAGTDKDKNPDSCYTVIQVWDVTPRAEMILIHEYREQVDIPTGANAAIDVVRRFGCHFLAVEQDGIGTGTIQTIELQGIAVQHIKARGSKWARSETAEIRMAAGMIYFPQGAEWLFDFETELQRFPNAEYCDRVDCLSHAAALIQERFGAPVSEDPQPIPDLGGMFKRTF